MIVHGTYRTVLTPLLVTTFVVVVGAPEARAFEREDIVCELEDLTRTISLRADPEAGYVCDVLYEKPDEGGAREVLWSARNDVDYCQPRFDELVKDLASRGWICDYAEKSGDSGDQPEIGAAQEARETDDETSSEGTKGKFRDWCVADTASGENVEGSGSVKSYCNCVADGMDSYGLTEDEAQVIFEGLSSLAAAPEGESNPVGDDKRLNTLAANYESVVDSCR